MFAFAGKLLRINLSKKTFFEEPINEETLKKYLGPRGFGANILFNELPRGVDPLGAENKIIFSTGPITGTIVPGGTRIQMIAKSPLTGGYGESSAAGSLGREMKMSGFDHIIIEGISPKPVYVWIDNGKVEFRSAEHLWGDTTGDAEDKIKKETSDKSSVAVIGPGGEKMCKFAAVLTGKHRAFGRTGMGAVMGSKKMKAIAIKGTGIIKYHDPKLVKKLIKELIQRIKEDPQKNLIMKYGTSYGVAALNEIGLLPTKNFQSGFFEECGEISHKKMADTILIERYRCAGCVMKCISGVEVSSGPFKPVEPKYGGPEYETLATLGSNCLNANLESIAKANELCNSLGIDTMSTGVVIAWAMECYEKGILRKEDLDGIELTWGNSEGIVELVRKIGFREGVGNLLSEGVRIASEKIGKGSQKFAMHVKGLEFAMQEPRGKKGQGLIYAMGPRGAAHTEAVPDRAYMKKNSFPEVGIIDSVSPLAAGREKAYVTLKGQDIRILLDLFGGCGHVFEPWNPVSSLTVIKEFINAATGLNYSIEELMTVSERANNIARAFNVREGMSKKDDILPHRMSEPLDVGPIGLEPSKTSKIRAKNESLDSYTGGLSNRESIKGQIISKNELDEMLKEYYQLREWDKNGIPTSKVLEKLGLNHIAEGLKKEGIL